jgi:GAF domain-containing protein
LVAGRAVVDRRVVHVRDLAAEPEEEFPVGRELARRFGHRTIVAVPLLRDGVPVGVVTVGRGEVRPFTEGQVELLRTFADQAVIAIENVRLFTELEARNRDLTAAHAQVTEALEQQTAASEILRVISSSPTDIQPVFDAIAHSAARLCEAFDVVVLRVQENVLHLVAHHGPLPVVADLPLHRRTLGGRTMIERRVIHILDLQAEVDEFPEGSAIAQAGGHRTTLSVPLLKEGVAIGNIQARRQEVRPFSDTQISLLTTFADQAVIAIENVRLFNELEARNAALTQAHAHVSETLDQQTATAEILRVIGASPTDAHPVFEAIARSGVRVCGALSCAVFVVDGEMLRLAATHGVPAARIERFRSQFPAPLTSPEDATRAVRERSMFHMADIENNPAATPGQIEVARLGGYCTRRVPHPRPSRSGKSSCSRPSPTRLSSPSRTCACSPNSRRATGS